MKKTVFLFTLVCVVLLSLVSVTAAQDLPKCDGLLKALEHIPPDRPGYAKVLEMAKENCGEAFDHAALLAFYESTDGANWSNNDGWLTGDHCTWHGVSCDTDGRVYQLNLFSNQLSGPIPAEVGNLSNLYQLNLPSNQLSGPIPAEVGNLSNLRNIFLSDNQLSGPIPAELSNLSNVFWLDLRFNSLACWETEDVLQWALEVISTSWDSPSPGFTICSP